MDKEEAQELFNNLMNLGMSNPGLPQELLEAIDYVANYCGDIASGRKHKPENIEDAFPTITKKAEVRGRIDENRWVHAHFGFLNRPKLDSRLAELQESEGKE